MDYGRRIMHLRRFGPGLFLILVAVLVLTVLRLGVAYTQQPAQPVDINHFFDRLVGEWIGTFAQSNGKVQAHTKYFHAVVTATGPASYKSVFEYYRIDEKTHKPVQSGVSQMITSIAPDGTATNVITGKGDVLINDEETPETHQFSETLRMTSLGVVWAKEASRRTVRTEK